MLIRQFRISLNNEIMETNVNQRIMKLFDIYKLSDNQAAGEFGISQSSISRQKKGDYQVSLALVEAILNKYPEVSAEWLLRGEGDMYKGEGSKAGEAGEAERVPEKEVMLIPAGARGGSFEYFNEQVGLSPYNSEVIRSPFINASFAWSVKDDSMAPDYPAGTVLFVKKLVTSIIKYGNCYVFDTDDGFQFVKLRRSELGDDYVHCVPLNAEDYEPYDVPKSDIHGIYKVLGAMRW